MYYFAILFCTLFVPFAQSLHVPSVVQFENKSEISEFNKIIDTNSESIPDKQNNFKSRLIRQALPMLVYRPRTNFRPISYPPQTSSKPITLTTGPAISYPPQTSSKPIIINTGPAISYPPQTSSKLITITTRPAIASCCLPSGKYKIKICMSLDCTIVTCDNGNCTHKDTGSISNEENLRFCKY
ncbi:uncharacterized protein LOC127286618 [Leptopilina boulardi]|uniref:uncharacterized protein LOC127286618 n=1 Tax=Leptopilina boulardi TaxID=63433 RepID=UPI0021F652FC|nr:uncharacterized protein LOC127286618 [Leptopilina boulardi]